VLHVYRRVKQALIQWHLIAVAREESPWTKRWSRHWVTCISCPRCLSSDVQPLPKLVNTR